MTLEQRRQRARRLNDEDAPDPVEKGDGGGRDASPAGRAFPLAVYWDSPTRRVPAVYQGERDGRPAGTGTAVESSAALGFL
jgi:hypothetical protein